MHEHEHAGAMRDEQHGAQGGELLVVAELVAAIVVLGGVLVTSMSTVGLVTALPSMAETASSPQITEASGNVLRSEASIRIFISEVATRQDL